MIHTGSNQDDTKKLLLLGTTGASFGDEKLTGGLECAVLEWSPPILARIRARAELILAARRQDSSLYEMYFWDTEPAFYNYDLISACEDLANKTWLKKYEERGYAPLPAEIIARLTAGEFEPRRTECDQMVISYATHHEISVRWVVIPKHDGIYVDTTQIPLTALEWLMATELA